MSTPTPRPADELLVQEVEDELVIYDLTAEKGHSLNPTAAYIFQQIDGQTSPADLAVQVEDRFEIDRSAELVEMTLARLQKANLVEGVVASSASVSRREMLQLAGKAGMAMALLPVISSIVAPTAAHAASTVGGECPPFVRPNGWGGSALCGIASLCPSGCETAINAKRDRGLSCPSIAGYVLQCQYEQGSGPTINLHCGYSCA